MTMMDTTVRFNDAGEIVGGKPDAPGMKVEGVTPETARAAMLVLGVMLTPMEAPAPASTSTPAAPSSTPPVK
jgi:hypothetical protein